MKKTFPLSLSKTQTLTVLTLLSCILFISGCSLYQIDSKDDTLDFYAPKASWTDIQYLDRIRQNHKVIGTVTINAERNQKLENVLTQMKKETALLGGDAITNLRTNAGTGKWAKIKPQKLLGNAHIRANFIADVIVFQ